MSGFRKLAESFQLFDLTIRSRKLYIFDSSEQLRIKSKFSLDQSTKEWIEDSEKYGEKKFTNSWSQGSKENYYFKGNVNVFGGPVADQRSTYKYNSAFLREKLYYDSFGDPDESTLITDLYFLKLSEAIGETSRDIKARPGLFSDEELFYYYAGIFQRIVDPHWENLAVLSSGEFSDKVKYYPFYKIVPDVFEDYVVQTENGTYPGLYGLGSEKMNIGNSSFDLSLQYEYPDTAKAWVDYFGMPNGPAPRIIRDQMITLEEIFKFIDNQTIIDIREDLNINEQKYRDYQNKWFAPHNNQEDAVEGYSLNGLLSEGKGISFDQALAFWKKFISSYLGDSEGSAELEENERKTIESGDVFPLDLESCSIVAEEQEEDKCPPPCVPDPNAIVENWTELSDKQTFLNQRTCEYNTVIETKYKNFNENDPATIQQEYVTDGLRTMLSSLGKDDSDTTINSLFSESTITTEYYLDTRPGTSVRVLVKAPSNDVNKIIDKELITGNQAQNTDDLREKVVLSNEDLRNPKSAFDIAKKAINRKYAKQYDIARYQNKLKGFPLNISLTAEGNMIGKFENNLIKLIKRSGFRLNPARKKIGMLEAVQIDFEENFSGITDVKVNNIGCEQVSLKGASGWDDFISSDASKYPSTLAFVSKLPEIVEDVTSNNPPAVDLFLQKYYYPTIEVEVGNDLTYAQNYTDQNNCSFSDIASNILKPNIIPLSSITGLALDFPEILAQELGNSTCLSLQGKIAQDRAQLAPELIKDRKKYIENKTFSDGDINIQNLIDEFVSSYENRDGPPLNPEKMIDSLNAMGKCGLASLISDAVKCIMRGLDYESSLETFLRSFLKSATDKELEKLFFSVPTNVQQLIRDSVSEITSVPLPWEAGYMEGSYTSVGVKYSSQYFEKGAFGTGSVEERITYAEEFLRPRSVDAGFVDFDDEGNLRNRIARNKTTFEEQQEKYNAYIPKPIFDSEGNPVTDEDGNQIFVEAPGGVVAAPGLGPRRYGGPFGHAGSIGVAADAIADNITGLIGEVIIDLIENNLISLDLLKDFVENEIPLGSMFKNFAEELEDCAKPPLFSPPLDDFLKTAEIDFCDGYYAISLPTIPSINLKAFMGDLEAAALDAFEEAIEELAARAVTLVMQKIFKVLMNGACETLKDTSSMIKGVVGGSDFREIIAENICGSSFNDKELNKSMNDLLNSLDSWKLPGFQPPSDEDIGDFIDGIASIVTQEELLDLFDGTPGPKTLLYARQIANGIPTIANFLPTEQDIRNFFISIGNVFDKEKLRDRISQEPFTPISPTICSSYEATKTFNQIRIQALTNKGLSTKEAQEQICMLKDLALQDLDSLLGVLNGGLYGDMNYFGDCPDEGLLPKETEETKTQRAEMYGSLYDIINASFLEDLTSRFGLLNMILSDVMGRGLRKHSEFYVGLLGESLSSDMGPFDFYADYEVENDTGSAGLIGGNPKGVFPDTIGADFQDELVNLTPNFGSSGIVLDYKSKDDDEVLIEVDFRYLSNDEQNDRDISINVRKTEGKDEIDNFNLRISQDKEGLEEYLSQNNSTTPNQTYAFSRIIQDSWSKYSSEAFDENILLNLFYYVTEFSLKNMSNKMSENARAFKFGFDPNAKAKVVYLDPEEFGGTTENPPYYVEPPQYSGWLGMYDKIVPESDSCETKSVINFDSISVMTSEYSNNLKEDDRLEISPECGLDIERPFERIMPKDSLAGTWGAIMATIRVYVTENMIKGLPAFSLFEPKLPGVYDEVLFSYLSQKIKDGLLQDGESFKSTTKREIYYLNFLEQVVQNYGKKVDLGEIVPNSVELEAMEEINTVQSMWENPPRGIGYKKRRKEKYENFIRSVEPEARILMNHFIEEEIKSVGENLKKALEPSISSFEGWFFGSPQWIAAGSLTQAGPLDVSLDPTKPDDPTTNIIANLVKETQNSYNPFILEKYISAIPKGSQQPAIYNINEFVTLISNQSGEISDNWESISKGIRICMLMPEGSTPANLGSSITLENIENVRSLRYTNESGQYTFVVPVASAEIDVNLESDIDIISSYDINCMISELINTFEYKLLFGYAVPLSSLLSLMTIYTIESFVLSVGQEWGIEEYKNNGGESFGRKRSQFKRWDKGDGGLKSTRRMLRRLFNDFYNARDISYEDPERETQQEKTNKSIKVKRKLPTEADIKWWQRKMQRPKPKSECEE